MALLVIREMMERLVNLVLLDQLESLVPQDHPEREALMALQVLREDRERREPRVNLAWKVLKERQVQLVLKDHLASLVLKASGVFLAQLENKVCQVLQALMDLLDQWVLLVCLV